MDGLELWLYVLSLGPGPRQSDGTCDLTNSLHRRVGGKYTIFSDDVKDDS